jgi:hypothetical protein
MTHFTIVHEIDGTLEEFWRSSSTSPTTSSSTTASGSRSASASSSTRDDQTIQFAIRVIPKRDLPALIKKIVGGDLGYTEISTYYKGKDEIGRAHRADADERSHEDPRALQGRGHRSAQAARSFEGDLHVDVPLVGRKVEATILEDVRRSYDIAAQVTNEWLKKGL